MKKVLALVLAVVMLCPLCVGAAPAFLSELYTNYTGNYSMTFKLDNVDNIMRVLEEEGVLEEIEKNVDIRGLLSGFSCGESMTVKADITNDMKTIKIHTATDVNTALSINENMNVSANLKSYMWITIDISDVGNPVFKIIKKTPSHNKYEYVDIAAQFSQEDKQEMVMGLSYVLNKEFLTGFVAESAVLLEKHATIDANDTECTIRIDDAGLKEIVCESLKMIAVQLGADVEAQIEIQEFIDEFTSMNIRLLGEDGILIKYGLENGKPKEVYTAIDLSVDLTQLVGSESEFSIDMLIEERGTISDIGTTVVEYPELNEENSFDGTIIFEEVYDDYEEWEPEYPNWNVYNWVDYLPVMDGKVYFPLRQILTEAYGDTMTLSYDNGAVTVNCEHFPSYKELSFAVGSDTVYTDGVAHTIGATSRVENGVTYVSETFVKEILGWSIFDVYYDLMQKKFVYDFATY